MLQRFGGSSVAHPKGLYVLFFTELWERYSFYSMMAILTLYMDEFLRFPHSVIGQVYGGYIGAVYLMPLLGGFIADRFLGPFRSVVVGGLLMTAGQFMLAVPSLPFFFTALILLACGCGLLKPNISNIVGNLYRDNPEMRDAGYNIFFMGINIGAFISPLAVSYFRAHYGWGVAFASGGFAMLPALAIFVAFRHLIANAASRVQAGGPGVVSLQASEARARTVALLLVFAIIIPFWIAFYQNGFTLTLWARDSTATTVPPERFQAINPLCIILFTPPVIALWSWLRRGGKEPTTVGKMLMGMLMCAACFAVMAAAGLAGGDAGRVSSAWLVSAYALISLGEVFLSPMGLSLVNKVAPPGRKGLLMGCWFVGLSIGGYISGTLGTLWYHLPHSQFFVVVMAVIVVATALLAFARQRLQATFGAAIAAERAAVASVPPSSG